jgi:hypothetical protein
MWWTASLSGSGTVTTTSGAVASSYVGSFATSTFEGQAPAMEECADGDGVIGWMDLTGHSQTGDLSGRLIGTYKRVGMHMALTLSGSATVVSATGTVTSAVTAIVSLDLIPTSGDCVLTDLSEADARGTWAIS